MDVIRYNRYDNRYFIRYVEYVGSVFVSRVSDTGNLY